MTDRHPMDCYITPPCAAIALGVWHGLRPRFLTALDPFAGPGTLVPWTGLAERAHARELDRRWESEARANAATVHIGDSFAMSWLIDEGAPHIITNPPYKLTREAHWLPRPEVPPEQRAEHKRLSLLAYHMGHEAQGA